MYWSPGDDVLQPQVVRGYCAGERAAGQVQELRVVERGGKVNDKSYSDMYYASCQTSDSRMFSKSRVSNLEVYVYSAQCRGHRNFFKKLMLQCIQRCTSDPCLSFSRSSSEHPDISPSSRSRQGTSPVMKSK